MVGVVKQIIGSFEEIGKDVVREVAKAPTDIAGKALESLGTSSGQKGQTPAPLPTGESKSEEKADDGKDGESKKSSKGDGPVEEGEVVE